MVPPPCHRYFNRQLCNSLSSTRGLTPFLFRKLLVLLAFSGGIRSNREGKESAEEKGEEGEEADPIFQIFWKFAGRMGPQLIVNLKELLLCCTKVLATEWKLTKAGKVNKKKQHNNDKAMRELLVAMGAIFVLAMSKPFTQAIVDEQRAAAMESKPVTLLYYIVYAYGFTHAEEYRKMVFRLGIGW